MSASAKSIIENGQAYLGIELGSTRIKSVLIDSQGTILAKGGFEWENHFVNGIWTYPLDEVWVGVAKSYQDLCQVWGTDLFCIERKKKIWSKKITASLVNTRVRRFCLVGVMQKTK